MPDSTGLETINVRLYFDRHITNRLALDLRGKRYDVLTTEEAGRNTAIDEEQLDFATVEGRAIFTFNICDFAPLHTKWQAAARAHAGIVVSQQLGNHHYSLLYQRMPRFLNHFSSDEMVNNFVHLEQFK